MGTVFSKITVPCPEQENIISCSNRLLIGFVWKISHELRSERRESAILTRYYELSHISRSLQPDEIDIDR